MEQATPYLDSLIHIWKQDVYLRENPPPAISARDVLLKHRSHLLPGWLDWWRSLYQRFSEFQSEQRQEVHLRGFGSEGSLEVFAVVVCVESLYSAVHRQKNGETVTLSWKDLISVLDVTNRTHRQELSFERQDLILETLAHTFVYSFESPQEREDILLVLLDTGFRARWRIHAVSNCVSVIRCIRMLTSFPHGLEARKQILMTHSQDRGSEDDVSEELYLLYQWLSNTYPSGGENFDRMSKKVLGWLLLQGCTRYNHFFIALPPKQTHDVLSVIHDVSRLDVIPPEPLNFVSGLLIGWYLGERVSSDNRITIINLMFSILNRSLAFSERPPFEPVHEKLLRNIPYLLQPKAGKLVDDPIAENHLCCFCARLVGFYLGIILESPPLTVRKTPQDLQEHFAAFDERHGVMNVEWNLPEFEWKRIILRTIHAMGIIESCAKFLSSSRCSEDTSLVWHALLQPWGKLLSITAETEKHNPLVVNSGLAYMRIRGAVGVFPQPSPANSPSASLSCEHRRTT